MPDTRTDARGAQPAPSRPALDGARADGRGDGQPNGEPNGDGRGGSGGARGDDRRAGGRPDEKARDEPRDAPRPVRRRSLVIGGLVVAAALVAFLLIGFLPRRSNDGKLRRQAQQTARNDSVPAVTVVRVARGDSAAEFNLPGNVQGVREAAVYARASGYVRRYLVDIGQRVRAGQTLALLDVPDVEEEARAAEAAARQAAASYRLAGVELARFRILYRDSTVTREELDQRQATYDAAGAALAAAQANARRAQQLAGYAAVTAPFAGVVTARNVDQGVLVGSGGASTTTGAAGLGGNTVVGAAGGAQTAAGGGSALAGASSALGGGSGGGGGGAAGSAALFRVAQADTVRLYVGVPQSFAGDVRAGLAAVVRVPDMPEREFRGRVVRTAGALDAATRTLLTEVDVANREGRLLPGMYAMVSFHLTRAAPPVTIPAGALLVRQQGPQAAVVGRDSVVRMRAITVGRDFGSALEVLAGLEPGDLVVLNPTDELRDGQRVHARPQAAGGAPGGDSPGGRPANPPQVKAEGGEEQGGKGGQQAQGRQGAGGPGGQQGGSTGSGQQGGGGGAGGGAAGGGQQGGRQGGRGGSQAGSQQPPVVRIGPPGRP